MRKAALTPQPTSAKDGDAAPARSSEDESREERLEAIKRAVQAGTYHVDAEQLSKKMIAAHLASKKPAGS